ncbi:hypothetical protein HN51_012929, partial [Arachis hypogaea]
KMNMIRQCSWTRGEIIVRIRSREMMEEKTGRKLLGGGGGGRDDQFRVSISEVN